jgi:hypothetical protein
VLLPVERLSATPAKGCGVTIEAITCATTPRVAHTPIPLHCMHRIRPESARVDLHPGETLVFDVVKSQIRKSGQPTIQFCGAVYEPEIEFNAYFLRLRATGDNVSPIDQEFRLSFEARGIPILTQAQR